MSRSYKKHYGVAAWLRREEQVCYDGWSEVVVEEGEVGWKRINIPNVSTNHNGARMVEHWAHRLVPVMGLVKREVHHPSMRLITDEEKVKAREWLEDNRLRRKTGASRYEGLWARAERRKERRGARAEIEEGLAERVENEAEFELLQSELDRLNKFILWMNRMEELLEEAA